MTARFRWAPSEEEVRLLLSLFSYDADTGVLWRRFRKGGFREVRTQSEKGYVIAFFGSRQVGAHRVIWLLMTGEWPPSDIDHINGVPSDNRWSNLRLVTHVQNCWNKAPPANLGTYFCPNKAGRRKWRSAIEVNGVRLHLGYFLTKEEAQSAYINARAIHHGEFARAA